MKSKNILSSHAWWPLNKAFVREYGIDAALLIADLSTKQEYFAEKGMLDEHGYFFNEKKDIENDTSLSLHRQSNAVEILKKIRVLFINKKGTPSRLYYRVEVSNLNKRINELHSL